MSYFNSRTHAFFTFTRDDEERMRNKFMPSTSEGTLCTYCEEVECSGTSEIDCIYSEEAKLGCFKLKLLRSSYVYIAVCLFMLYKILSVHYKEA